MRPGLYPILDRIATQPPGGWSADEGRRIGATVSDLADASTPARGHCGAAQAQTSSYLAILHLVRHSTLPILKPGIPSVPVLVCVSEPAALKLPALPDGEAPMPRVLDWPLE